MLMFHTPVLAWGGKELHDNQNEKAEKRLDNKI